jgi:branched-chain amino acid transport system substrate-binding protein
LNAGAIAVAAIAAIGGCAAAFADQKVVKIGITLPFTGADAEDANLIKNGAMIAIDEANAAGGVAGYKVVPIIYDDGTATAGQYDPAQSATNAKKLISDPLVIANVGPQMSGSGKAISPILSEADLATITPSSTNPDITDPKMAGQFRPKGKAVYFRTVTTDAYQGPNMANYFKAKLNVKTVYILDDSGAYGVGLAGAFENQAKKIGIEVLGHDQLDPKEADYTTALTKIKALHPDALYYGGVAQAGVKLAKQAAETIPTMIKGGGDGVSGGSFLKGGGFPAIEGWYATNAGPHLTESQGAASFVKTFQEKYHSTPDDYSITAYDAAKVILAAVAEVAKSGKEMNRSNVRDAIQSS